MASISYEDIFSDFLGRITDYQIASLDVSDAYALMTEQLHKTLSQAYVRHLFSSVSMDDDIQFLTYEMEQVVDEDSDAEFVRNVISRGMVIEWLYPQVRSKLLTSQMFTGKEAQFFSQASHLTQLRGLLEDTQLELRKAIRDRGYIYNNYLGVRK